MTGLELFLLGRKLMKLGEEAIPPSGFHQMPTSVRSVLIDVFEHPGSSVSEITARTGFPQSHVSASVAKLRDVGGLVTEPDPTDRRRTLVRPAPTVRRNVSRHLSTPIDATLARAISTDDPGDVSEALTALEFLAEMLAPEGRRQRRPGARTW